MQLLLFSVFDTWLSRQRQCCPGQDALWLHMVADRLLRDTVLTWTKAIQGDMGGFTRAPAGAALAGADFLASQRENQPGLRSSCATASTWNLIASSACAAFAS